MIDYIIVTIIISISLFATIYSSLFNSYKWHDLVSCEATGTEV